VYGRKQLQSSLITYCPDRGYLHFSSVSSGEFHASGDTGCQIRVLYNDYLIRNRKCLPPYSITTQMQVQRVPRMSLCAAGPAVSRWQIIVEQWLINYTSQQDFGTRKVYCVSNVTFHAESKYAIKIFPSPTVFVRWPF